MRPAQLASALKARHSNGLLRQSQLIDRNQGRYLQLNGQCYLNFSANDYLGLANSAELKASLSAAANEFGVGSTGSPLVTGHHQVHQQLCEQLADWLGFDRVLLFSSGFAANQAMLQSLVDSNDQLFLDKLCHASLIDAALHHQGRFRRFAHNDVSALAKLLSPAPTDESHSIVVTEGVFSMDGDSPDLVALSQLCRQQDAALLLDDAHGLGVLGEEGRGSWAAQGLAPEQLYCYMANFGKALGVGGAFLAGSHTVIEYIEQFARHYIYSTALSPALCATVSDSIRRVRHDQWRRDKLTDNIQLFRQLASAAELPCLNVSGAIQAIIIGDSAKAVAISTELKNLGIWLTAIRPPTVPVGGARLRVTLSAAHQPDDIHFLIKMLQQAVLC